MPISLDNYIRIVYIIGVMRGITPNKRKGEKMNAKNEKLEDAVDLWISNNIAAEHRDSDEVKQMRTKTIETVDANLRMYLGSSTHNTQNVDEMVNDCFVQQIYS